MSAPGHRPVFPITRADAAARRRFLKLMAASTALAGAGCKGPPGETIVPWVRMPESAVPGRPLFYASAFVRRGHAHGVLVETNTGRPTKVEGNPDHPIAGGATDVFTQASILQLWDPDRSQTVQQGTELSTWPAFEAALAARRPAWTRDGGAGLRILSGPSSSPTLARQLDAVRARWPEARVHFWDPLQDDGAAQASRLAFGRVLEPQYRLDRVSVLLALDADLLGSGPAGLLHARSWADGRRLGEHAGERRLYALESTPTLTGAHADERLARSPREIAASVWRIAALLRTGADAGQAPDARTARWEAAVAKALDGARGRALVVAGPTLDPASRALVHLLNQRLGAPVDHIAPTTLGDAAHAASIAALAADMHAGRVDTLLMLDANPVYTAPADLDFARALARVPLSAHLGLYRDETGHAARWHLPLAHGYETWSDARAADGTASIVQPMIAPLYAGRSAHEVLALLDGEGSRDGLALVRATWRERGLASDDAWREALRIGFVAGSAAEPVAVPTVPLPRPPAPAKAAALVAVFAADPSVDDGAFANNGWLQELPRPLTSISWDNAAFIGPASAARAGIASGDRVRLRVGGRTVDAPVLVLADQAEGVVTLPLGYGRRAAGSIGNGVGFDAYRLRTVDTFAAAPALAVERLAEKHDFAMRQREFDMHGRAPVRVAELRRGRAVPTEAPEEPVPKVSMYPERSYDGYKWGMAIDLNACIGCGVCTIACQAENNIPIVGKEEVMRGRAMHWIRVDRYVERRRTLFQPVPCMHCEHAPCEEVCPVGATVHDGDGLNVQVYNRCVGTRFCSNNCPYKVRRFNFLQYSNEQFESLKALQNPEVTVRRRGVMEKCTYCLQRITRARIDAERAGRRVRDGEVVTACQAACPTRAIRFGDLNDPKSDVVAAKASAHDYVLLEELNTRPRTSYIARVVNPDPEAG
ncbi:4Fe-4S dicluster domain-containing protein [Massilia sp. YIM B02763]|uniref:4Fe-4S dicluster domain-containing protein n=1 Tax=Massilia sp. YIM B02763 TaxID=3050130 RepID=UPI0025B6E4D9|nr:4Fe-4S dicluster domain-containing protein [Massilia sp. YIM B02763]MDN4051655.1 4Fe-4S dicluster domain-containing protein [Massilia sp. YIM B02763]